MRKKGLFYAAALSLSVYNKFGVKMVLVSKNQITILSTKVIVSLYSLNHIKTTYFPKESWPGYSSPF